MSEITQNADYVGDMRGNLPEQDKAQPRIDAMLVAFAAEAQQLEDSMWDVLVDRLLQNYLAADDLLDKLGAIVGQARNGSSDDEYRIFIGARIKTNRSDGRRETLLAIALLLVPTADPIVFREYLKAVEIEVNGIEVSAFIAWRDFLNQAKVAGTSLRFFSSSVTTAETLTRTSVYGGVTTVTGQRKGSVYGGGGTGVFANVFGDG